MPGRQAKAEGLQRARAGSEAGGEPCPICGRPLVDGPSVNRHHLVPRAEGGRETVRLHRICHRKLHSLWTERELARAFAGFEAIRAHPEMQAFIRWVRRKPPERSEERRVGKECR